MLLQIEPASTSENATIKLHEIDNVATARRGLGLGDAVRSTSGLLNVRETIPLGHKIALEPIVEGQAIRRYGEIIGFAKANIQPGDHVHEHNLGFDDREPEAHAGLTHAVPVCSTRSFLGYRRADGRVGTRNYIAVAAASNCAAHAVDLIAQSFSATDLPPHIDGVIAFAHGDGCGQAMGPDTDQLRRTISGLLQHPNVAAALMVGLGCEVNQIDHYLRSDGPPSALPIQGLTMQSSGGTMAVVQQAHQQIKSLMQDAVPAVRTSVPASNLVLGLNCGGSDSFSGITANPALGYCCDLLVREGGTVVLAETTEIFGAHHLLLRRAKDETVRGKLQSVVDSYRAYLRQFGGSFNDNPSPGNKAGGLTNIVEKSLGAVAKSGTTPLNAVYEYAERIDAPGLTFMNTPGYDPVSLAGLAAGGANLIAFTTGRGSAIGFPSVPVFKISSNSAISRRMADHIDLNAGTIGDGVETIEQVGTSLFEALLQSASGIKTKAELLGHNEFVPWRIGPVL